ncbi:SDR family oxidoreductase [Cupriavidus sp. UME77]|uniref:SDR family oxidoreductase n=1 Tax=Cupriavidus sp. UME77 TaxID=1862321 RepID=UPI0016030660|nr:SDR family oxidoreductase [Cupriavidus sp. UME77]MBB1632876.1 short-chain dehydrogenase [Cupriavidus sp. UME77]
MFKNDLFAGQRVLITGGGTGLGLIMAERLAGLGAELHLCGRRLAVLDEAAEMLRHQHGTKVVTHAVDIRDAAAVDAMIETIWTRHGPLDCLVNNAAGNFISRTEDLSPNGFHAISDIVFRGTFYTTQAVGKRWIRDGHPGSVLSIVVTWVWTGSPFVVPSAMSKAGVDAMTKSLAVEWGRHGIRCNAIAPGVIPTEGAGSRLRPQDAQQDAMSGQNPTGRIGQPQDIGNLAAFLLARDNAWINGQTIALDGGDYLANGAYFKQYLDWGDAEWQAARERIAATNAADRAGRTVNAPTPTRSTTKPSQAGDN